MADNEDGGGGVNIGAIVGVGSAVAAVALYFLKGSVPQLEIVFLLTCVVVISVVIWQACDPFAEAAQWIGTKFHIPGSVRGATLDAIASSMPELFSGIFFVVVAITAAQDAGTSLEAAGSEGYGSTIATCAGSAVYNMVLIPAIVAIFIAVYRKNRPTVDVEDEVLMRDGVWFLVCELVLLGFLFQPSLYWWMGIIFFALYGGYVFQLYRDAMRHRRQVLATHACLEAKGLSTSTEDVISAVASQGLSVKEELVDHIRQQLKAGEEVEEEEEEEAPDSAEACFGLFEYSLNNVTAWLTIIVTTIVAAVACYFLVEVTRGTADTLNVPTFFVAVIIAAAASSVPDTFLSIGSAMRGDDSGAVSNAFGSNIFDICICLSVPLLVNSYLVGWGPVNLTQDGEPIAGLVGLRILLFVLTGVTLAIMWHNRQLTFRKAIVLCSLYAIFLAYAVLGSLDLLGNVGL